MSDSFTGIFTGRLEGILSEEGYSALAASLKGEWLAIKFAEGAIERRVGEWVGETLEKLRAEVKARRMMNISFPYTYVHTLDNPKMIKIYDPSCCGSGCSSTSSPDPWWVFSAVEPGDGELEALRKTKPEERMGLLGKIFG